MHNCISTLRDSTQEIERLRKIGSDFARSISHKVFSATVVDFTSAADVVAGMILSKYEEKKMPLKQFTRHTLPHCLT